MALDSVFGVEQRPNVAVQVHFLTWTKSVAISVSIIEETLAEFQIQTVPVERLQLLQYVPALSKHLLTNTANESEHAE